MNHAPYAMSAAPNAKEAAPQSFTCAVAEADAEKKAHAPKPNARTVAAVMNAR